LAIEYRAHPSIMVPSRFKKKMVLFGKNKIQILTVENRRKDNHGLWNIQLTFPFCSIWSGCRRRLGELCTVYFKRLDICMNRQK
jgi:hypothetical protein